MALRSATLVTASTAIQKMHDGERLPALPPEPRRLPILFDRAKEAIAIVVVSLDACEERGDCAHFHGSTRAWTTTFIRKKVLEELVPIEVGRSIVGEMDVHMTYGRVRREGDHRTKPRFASRAVLPHGVVQRATGLAASLNPHLPGVPTVLQALIHVAGAKDELDRTHLGRAADL